MPQTNAPRAHRFAPLPDQSELELAVPVDPDALRGDLSGLLLRLRESLPANCKRLEQGTIEFIGQFAVDGGGTADVWKGKMGDSEVAIKHYRLHSSSNLLLTSVRFYKEALTGSHLKHQNVVQFIGTYSSQEKLTLVYAYMENLSLGIYLKGNGNAGRLSLLSDIAHGVEYIHKLNVVHGGIRIANILVDSNGRARVAGLGAAYISSLIPEVDIDKFFDAHGAAPELVNPQHFGLRNARATKESDMHAFGALAYEMFAGKAPIFEEGKLVGAHSNSCGRRSPRPNHPELSERVWDIIKGCLEQIPSRRKTIAEVVVVLDEELNSH